LQLPHELDTGFRRYTRQKKPLFCNLDPFDYAQGRLRERSWRFDEDFSLRSK